jgi:hypothetical protein
MPIAAHNANLMLRLTLGNYGDLANVRNGWKADMQSRVTASDVASTLETSAPVGPATQSLRRR